jgi:subtilisin-like proprotein convertase family protein
VWVLTAVDTLPEDQGTLNQFTIVDRGRRFLAAGLPATIPDDDPIGVSALVEGTTTMGVDAGGPVPDADTPPSPSAGDVRLELDVSHTYVGDLQVQMIVANLDGGEVLCRIDLRAPDPQEGTDDLALDTDVSACSGFYPPSRQQAWVIRVADVAQADVGEVTRFVITGPDGDHTGATPQAIPDQDPTGLLIPITR